MIEALTHNSRNAVTHSIERIEHERRSVIRKVLNGLNTPDTPPEWRASESPSHWNYWQREAHVYQSDLPQALVGSGVRLPEVIQRNDQGHRIEMILEDIHGRSGAELTLADYATACYGWGKAQAQIAASQWRTPWTSRGFLRDYITSKPVDYQLLYQDEAWSRPLIAENWPDRLRGQLVWLYENQATLLSIVESSERVPSHLDFWPNNVFVDHVGDLVPIDWAFYGEGALAEDIANFIPDAVFDGFIEPQLLPRMERELFSAYVAGLVSGGKTCDIAEVLRTFHACAVKYVWLGPLMLQKAGESVQRTYGGIQLDDANRQYRNRGLTLSYICDWAASAVAAQ